MSRTIFDAPITLPSSSLIGEMVSETEHAPAVGAHALGLEVLDSPARLQLAMISSSSARRSGGMTSEMWRPTACCGGVAEQPLGGRVPALDDAVERLADDRVVRRFDDRREQARRQQLAACSRSSRRCAVTSRKISTQPETPPRSSRIGAALSSIGHSAPSWRISTVWFARPTTTPSRSARVAGLSTGAARRLVDDAEHGRRAAGRRPPRGSSRSATRPPAFRYVTRPLDVGGDDGVADAAQRDAQHLAPLARARLRDTHRLADPMMSEQVKRYATRPDDVADIVDGQRAPRRDEEIVARRRSRRARRRRRRDSRRATPRPPRRRTA